ncbi:CHAD domain-containing protein [Streptomyces sp. NPDC004065]|uniref:CHAD domain-containing protein n=1 Tax=Streptomyces sp. NPDC004065 TaxID=3364689 RepID=UPI00384AB31D
MPADALAAHLRAQATEFLRALRLHRETGGTGNRNGTGESVDAARALRRAVRRISGSLHTFRPLLDEPWSQELRPELAWLSGTLALEQAYRSRLERLLLALHRLSGSTEPTSTELTSTELSGARATAAGPSGGTLSGGFLSGGSGTAANGTAGAAAAGPTGDPAPRSAGAPAPQSAGAPATRSAGAPAPQSAGAPATRSAGGPAPQSAGAPAARPAGDRTPLPAALSATVPATAAAVGGRVAGAVTAPRNDGPRTAPVPPEPPAPDRGRPTAGAARAGALLERRLTLARTRAHSAALQALGSSRFHALADKVAVLAGEVPLAPAAAAADLRPLAAAAEERLTDAVAALPLATAGSPYNAQALVHALSPDPSPHPQDAPWHQVRLLLRLHRYAREVLDGGPAGAGARLRAASRALDRHRDASEAAAAAASAARTPRIAPATAYALGVLHADQRHEVEAARFAFQRSWPLRTAGPGREDGGTG